MKNLLLTLTLLTWATISLQAQTEYKQWETHRFFAKRGHEADFEKGLAELEITLNEKQIEQFLTYYELLVEWNKVMNLTAITAYEAVITKHPLASVASVKVCDYSKPMKILYVGRFLSVLGSA